MSEYGQPEPNRPFVPEHGIIANSPLNPNHTSSQHQAPKPKRHTLRTVAIVVGSLIAILVLAAVLTPGTSDAPASVTTKAGAPVDNGPTPDPVVTPTNKPQPSPRVTHKPAPAMTASQVQAIGSAESYLAFTAFSRKGLIHQLVVGCG